MAASEAADPVRFPAARRPWYGAFYLELRGVTEAVPQTPGIRQAPKPLRPSKCSSTGSAGQILSPPAIRRRAPIADQPSAAASRSNRLAATLPTAARRPREAGTQVDQTPAPSPARADKSNCKKAPAPRTPLRRNDAEDAQHSPGASGPAYRRAAGS